MTDQQSQPDVIDDPAFLTALVTEHFVLQTARSIGTGEATSRGGLYVATLSSGLVATGFASGKPYFAGILAGILVVVLVLGLITFARLVEISREDLQRLRDIHIVHQYYGSLSPNAAGYFRRIDVDNVSEVIETQYARHSPWLVLTSAASLVAILNAVVLSAGLVVLTATATGAFHPWDIAVGVAGGAVLCWLTLRFEYVTLTAAIG